MYFFTLILFLLENHVWRNSYLLAGPFVCTYDLCFFGWKLDYNKIRDMVYQLHSTVVNKLDLKIHT